MSEASRAHALAHAAAVHHGSGDAAATLETAAAFHSFVTADSQPADPAPAKATKTVKAAAKPKPVEEPKDEADDDAPEGEAVTREEVGEVIEQLLNANLRPQVVALFAKYKAKSLGSINAKDYAAVKAAAEDLLLNA